MTVDRDRLFLLLSITGFGFALIAFHVLNALADVSGQFARVMLGLSDTSIRLAQAKALAEEERANVRTKFGPPDVLQLQEVAKPAPKDNEVLK